MARSVADKRAAFRRLHEAGCFVLPNPWDLGSAVLLQHLGFKALATTSAGMAWSMGRADGAVTRDEALRHFSQIADASELPPISRTPSPTRRTRWPRTSRWRRRPASPGSR